jgi:CheY-like chemotaxis protein
MNPWDRSILLIEDNPVDIDLTLRAFARRKLRNRIEVARDGEEALQFVDRWQAGETPPVLVLLDLKLPKVDGLEVLRRIKSQSKFSALPVIVLTSSAEDRDIKRAYELGANSYIVKPVEFDKFMEVAGQLEIYWCVLNRAPDDI